MWTIIKSYQVGEIAVDGVSGKDGLLLWVKRSLTDYPTVDVTNFTSSWANGMAFCALIHKHYPTVIDFDSLSPANATENVTLGTFTSITRRYNDCSPSASFVAFNLMEAKFGIPQLLNVGDVAGNPKPDDKSIMTYVSLLFQEFASGVQKKKAITTICKAVAMAQRISECRTQYETSAPTLLAWYSEKCQAWTAPEPTASLKTGVMGRWVASCKNNHRDIPKMHPSFDSIALLRKQLQEVEVQYETACRYLVGDLIVLTLDATLNSVLLDLTKLEGWLDKVNQDFPEETDKPVTNSADAEEALESMRFFHEVEVGRYQQLLTRVEVAVETKLAGQTTAVDAIARVETTRATFAVTLTRMQTLQERMKDMLAHQHQVDAVVKAMRLTIKTLKNEIEMLDEKIDAHNVHAAVDDSSDQEAALTAMKDAFSADVAPLVEANVVSVYTAELESKRDTLVRAHRDTELQTLDAFARRVDRLIAKRDAKVAELDQAVTDAHRRVTLSVDFAKLATTMVEHAASISNQINAVDGSLDEQLAALVALDTTEMHTKDDPAHLCAIMDELEVVNESLESLRVFSNPHTTETIQSCRATFASLQQALMERQQELEKEIAMDKLGHITPAQLNEVQEVFNHFDLDKDGKLARDEFIMACKGLGFDMSEESCHDMFDKLDTDKSDEIDLREFSTFCADQLQSGSTQTDVLAAFEILARDMAITQDKLHEHFDATVLEYLLKHMPHMMPSKTEDSDDIAIPDKYDYNAFAAALFQ
ncbi:hypothetical protein DYB32_006641 [Aphanomyces invadans]|uniref:Uncharacterized protein n=1 Tax=Aphanomyces invadans TaxID=157072 RepID=A0A3R6Z1N3_9STRA|nr:hypothetical protein DYB32_006641 [Aphanomyces invadans]